MRALIIDDERLARSELKQMLSSFPSIELVGEAKNADEALALIDSLKPDLLFLDIQMPGKNGFELLEALTVSPQVIFVTAYDQYALKAFDASAIDYLLKPIETERLKDAIAKLPPASESAVEAEGENIAALSLSDKVFLKDGEQCWFVQLQQISAMESIGNYTRVFFEKNKPLIRRSLAQLQERLSEKDFFRANRQTIINLHHISDVEASISDGLDVTLQNGVVVEISRRQAQQFKKLMSF